MSINSMLLRQHGRVFYYATTKHPTNYFTMQTYAMKRGWRVLEGIDGRPGETTWKMEQLVKKFGFGGQWEVEQNPKREEL